MARIVIKLGSSTVTENGVPHVPRLLELVRQISALAADGEEIILVSSGAVACGRTTVQLHATPRHVPIKQMLAAIGQPKLMALYGELFGFYGLNVAQVLLTKGDVENRRRYLNSRNTLLALIKHGVLPIINENDTVATDEIRLGDNDTLAARVASLIDADQLILLTDQIGLYDSNPRSNAKAKLVERVDSAEIPEALWQAAAGSAGALGTGGMTTKLQAADLARRGGCEVIIGDGRASDALIQLLKHAAPATRFSALSPIKESRKRFILAGGKTSGELLLDEGAVDALQRNGSLLPVGITQVSGVFERGETVAVKSQNQKEVARGIVNYSSEDLRKVCGKRSEDFENILGYHFGDEAIHRNDLVLL